MVQDKVVLEAVALLEAELGLVENDIEAGKKPLCNLDILAGGQARQIAERIRSVLSILRQGRVTRQVIGLFEERYEDLSSAWSQYQEVVAARLENFHRLATELGSICEQ